MRGDCSPLPVVLMGLYMPVSIICYGILGDDVPDNVMEGVTGEAVKVVTAFLLIHFLFAFSIIVNPVNQTLEEIFNTPNSKRGLCGFMYLRACACKQSWSIQRILLKNRHSLGGFPTSL